MKKKAEKSFIPVERHETIRQKIISVLTVQPLSAKGISGEVKISEKEVYGHLEHIQQTLDKKGQSLIIIPSECRKCGFSFSKRERLKKPGKCPVCHSEMIQEPLFFIET